MAVPLLFFPKEPQTSLKPLQPDKCEEADGPTETQETTEKDPVDLIFEKISDVHFITEHGHFQESFALTFTLYCSPTRLMGLMLKKFAALTDNPENAEDKMQHSMLTVFLEKWVTLRYHDFFENPELESALRQITSQYFSSRKKGSVQRMTLPLKQFWEESKRPLELNLSKRKSTISSSSEGNLLLPKASNANISPSSSNSSLSASTAGVTLLSTVAISTITSTTSSITSSISGGTSPLNAVNSFEDEYLQNIAEQLTLVEWKLLRRIHPSEYLEQAWAKKFKEMKAPNLVFSIDWFNRMSLWYSTCIVKEKTPEDRAAVITNCISIGAKCAKLKNFNGVIQVLSSLHSSAINRLRKSWKYVSKRAMTEFEELGNLMNPKLGWKNYRETLSKSSPPFIPYLGMFLTDLTYLDDCKENLVNGEVNIEKVTSLAKSILPLLVRPQVSSSYDIDEDATVMQKLLNETVWDEGSIYSISKLHEEGPSSSSSEANSIPNFSLTSLAKNFENLSAIGQTKVKTNSTRKDLSKRDWTTLLAKAIVKTCNPGEIIISPNSENFYLYRVKSGKLSVYLGQYENDVKLRELSADDMFGEMSILDVNHSNPHTVRAEVPTELYRLDLPSLLSIFAQNPNLAKKFYRLLATRLARLLKSGPGPSAPSSSSSSSSASSSSSSSSSSSQPSSNIPSVTLNSASSKNLLIPSMKENKEERIRAKLGISEPEMIVKEYHCILKSATAAKSRFGIGGIGVLKETIAPAGTLYLFQSNLGFFAQVFHVEFKCCLSLRQLSGITLEDDNIIISDKKHKMILKFKENVQDVYAELATVWASAQLDVPKTPRTALRDHRERSRSRSQSVTKYSNQYDDPLTPEDWEVIMRSAKQEKYKKDEIILHQGEQYQRIHQIAKGDCRIEKHLEDSEEPPLILGRMHESETFGEVSFLEGGGAAVSIVADCEEVEVYIIEGYYINMLFEMRDPGFASRFYHYLCIVLAHHLSKVK